jgi:hypothetical protein
MLTLALCSVDISTELRVTSAPVPAVVGGATNGDGAFSNDCPLPILDHKIGPYKRLTVYHHCVPTQTGYQTSNLLCRTRPENDLVGRGEFKFHPFNSFPS